MPQPRNPDGTFTYTTSLEERLEACEKAGVPLRLAPRLTGKDAAELLADAQALRAELGDTGAGEQAPADDERPWLNKLLNGGRGQVVAAAAQEPAPASESEPPPGSGAATTSERLAATVAAGLPIAHAASLTGDTLEEVTADAKRHAADLAASAPAHGRGGWIEQALGGAAVQEQERPSRGGFDGSNSAGGGDRPAVSGSSAVDEYIRRQVIGG